MAELSDVTQYLPSKESLLEFGKGTFSTLTIFLVVAIFLIIAGIVVYFVVQRFKFNKKIEIWKKIGGHWERLGYDRAKELKYGMAGDSVFYLRKRRKYLPYPELQVGRNLYWFAIREDGEWINIDLEDVDFTMKRAKAKFLHPEMRYARTALLRNLKDRLDKPKFLEKYGMVLATFGSLIIILVFMWLIVDKLISIGDQLTGAISAVDPVLDKAEKILVAVDNVCANTGVK